MWTFEQASQALEELPLRAQTERIPIGEAGGRILAQPVVMDRDQPSFDRATMDGYAVHLLADATHFEVVGTVPAGQRFKGAVAPGQAVRIMTGAPVPEGTTVVPIEQTDGGDRSVHVSEPDALEPGRNIAWTGEDARTGDRLLEPGTRLGPAQVAAAAMAGASIIEVACAPRVGIVTTGDEVGREDAEAGVRDSNGPLLQSLLTAFGCAVSRTHARDDEETLRKTLAAAIEANDVVVTTGGVSMGSRDLVPDTLAALGFDTVFHKVAVQPGKPILVARRGNDRAFLGLPGNPVSVLATAHLFLLPVLRRFCGGKASAWITLPMARPWSHPGRRHLFLPAALVAGGVEPVRWNGSGDLFAASAADGLASMPAGASWQAGDPISFLPYSAHEVGQRGSLPERRARKASS